MSKPVLGRGLNALLGSTGQVTRAAQATPDPAPAQSRTPDSRDGVGQMPIERIRPCPFQPRKDFSDDSIQELADSIKAQGIVQPLIVRPRGDGFELIAGERRWRAAQVAGLREVPIIIREADDDTVLELALVENLQRENLNPIEEALGYSQLMQQFGLTQEVVATKVGKNRASVANALRLLKLPPELQNHVRHNRLSVGHAKVILGLTDGVKQLLAAEKVLKENLNVRQAEELVSRLSTEAKPDGSSGGTTKSYVRDAHIAALESKLQERFGTKVLLRYRKGKGAVEIRFFNDEDLERVLELLAVQTD